MEWLKGLFVQMDAKNNNPLISIEKRNENTNKPEGWADFTSCSHTNFTIISTGLHCNTL